MLVRPRYPALNRGKKKNNAPPMRMAPAATLSAARISARASWRSCAGCANGGTTAPFPPRRISMPTNVATPNNRKMKKRTRNEVSTVKIAAARIAENARMARKKASRSVAALYKRTSITNSRKCTAPSSAAKSEGFVEVATNAREKKRMSKGKMTR